MINNERKRTERKEQGNTHHLRIVEFLNQQEESERLNTVYVKVKLMLNHNQNLRP